MAERASRLKRMHVDMLAVVIWLELDANDLHMFQHSIAVISCCSKRRLFLTFWYRLTPVIMESSN